MKITEEYLAHLQMVTADFDTCTHEQLVVNALNSEDEIGDTVIHRAFDRAIETAIDNGCEGVTP